MNREQLAHVLRAASSIVTDQRILVIGSQSILATYDEEELPVEATASVEVDLAFFDDDDEARADQVDGAIGELSQFHVTFGFYAQGVSVKTAVLPNGWRNRVVMCVRQDPRECQTASDLRRGASANSGDYRQ